MTIAEYRKKLNEHREIEQKLKDAKEQLRELNKQYQKSENDLKALQSVGQIVGEVLKQLTEEKFIVKATNGPRYVVGCRRKLDKKRLKPGTRVALDMTTLTIMRHLPDGDPGEDEQSQDEDGVEERDPDDAEEEEEEEEEEDDACLSAETSFVLRQQAKFIAKLNCLERQVKELRDTVFNSFDGAATNDNSGGEYSGTSTSDDDELSSLLDQITRISSSASSTNSSANPAVVNQSNNFPLPVVPGPSNLVQITQKAFDYPNMMNNPNHQNHQILSHSYLSGQQSQQQPQHYHHHVTTLPPQQQLHLQSFPILVMNPPIPMSHPGIITSSSNNTMDLQQNYYLRHQSTGINSSTGNLNTLSTANQHRQRQVISSSSKFGQHLLDHLPVASQSQQIASSPNQQQVNSQSFRSSQIGEGLETLEQLVVQKERRQIKLLLKSAENWIKLRSTGANSNFSNNNVVDQRDVTNLSTAVDHNNSVIKHNGGSDCPDDISQNKANPS